MRNRAYCILVVLPLLMLVAGPGQSADQRHKRKHGAPTPKMNRLPTGNWGGKHIEVKVTEAGAQISYDCARGTIDESIVLDKDGKFDVKGRHFVERGGPLRASDNNAGQPARYTGTAIGKTMTLSVMLTDAKESIGTFTVSRGQPARLFKCM